MSKYVVTATWDDVPHLTQLQKDEMLASTLPYLRMARSKGIPALGAGAIYPYPEDELLIDPFPIPVEWALCYGMDVGWKKTAALWGAYDEKSDVLYIYSEYYSGYGEPAVHAQGIRARGDFIPGVIDPASNASNQKDGSRLMEIYQSLGLDLAAADNAVEAGILRVWNRMVSGRLKIFRHLTFFLREFRNYHRDENGRVVKQDDHLMDCLRYMAMSGIGRGISQVEYEDSQTFEYEAMRQAANRGQAGKSAWTGY